MHSWTGLSLSLVDQHLLYWLAGTYHPHKDFSAQPLPPPAHIAGAHKAAAHKASTAQPPPSASSQLKAARQDGAQQTSFAASALSGTRAAQPAAPGLLGRVLSQLRPSPAPPAHASDALPSAPSFAAAPLLHGRQPPRQHQPAGPPRPNAVLAAAHCLTDAASSKAAATTASPLYRFAKLAGAGRPAASPAPAGGMLSGLKKYAELPAQQAQQGRGGGVAKKAAQKAVDAKALLRYARLK